jgi:DNA helicase II / ATP-dependent DNA helicase PcrA
MRLLVNSGPGTGKTFTASSLTCYLRATNKDLWLSRNKHTDEQLAIYRWVENNIPIQHDSKIIAMAYNREAADQLSGLTHKSVECRTAHGWGYKVLNRSYGYIRINNARTFNIIEQHLGQSLASHKDKYKWVATARYLAHLKDELLDPTPENIEKMAEKYDDLASFKPHQDMTSQIQTIMPMVKKPDRKVGIEYIDQVWLALFLLKSPLYDFCIVDECQDLSPSRFLLSQLIAKHAMYVGDPDQAVNAFAGADPYSIDRIRELCDEELPLKLTFRNPPAVVKKLNAFKPTAKLRGLGKPDGVEKRVILNRIAEELTSPYGSHLMVCRTNAPLVRVALRLIKAQIPCRILGDRLIDDLKNIVKNRKGTTLDDFSSALDKYEQYVTKDVSPYIAEMVKDKCDCIRMVLPLCTTRQDIEPTLDSFLRPKDPDHVRLSTIHKSKGLEAPNVFILFPPIQSPYAVTPEQIAQEDNLRYVAESRTSLNTYYVVEE